MEQQLYRWVKASERTPDNDLDLYNCRSTGKSQLPFVMTGNKLRLSKLKNTIEWLEPIPSQVADSSIEEGWVAEVINSDLAFLATLHSSDNTPIKQLRLLVKVLTPLIEGYDSTLHWVDLRKEFYSAMNLLNSEQSVQECDATEVQSELPHPATKKPYSKPDITFTTKGVEECLQEAETHLTIPFEPKIALHWVKKALQILKKA